jgi:hypothetical protein
LAAHLVYPLYSFSFGGIRRVRGSGEEVGGWADVQIELYGEKGPQLLEVVEKRIYANPSPHCPFRQELQLLLRHPRHQRSLREPWLSLVKTARGWHSATVGRAEPLVEVAGSGHIGVDLPVMLWFGGNVSLGKRHGTAMLYVNWRAVICGA